MTEEKVYESEEALKLVQGSKKEKFDSTIELHLRLGIDPKKGEHQVRGTVDFPHSFGRTKRVMAITSNPSSAKEAGALTAGGSELIKEIKDSGKCDYDAVVAEPEFMKELASVSKLLGPKGLMPSPKNETVTNNIAQTVSKILKGRAVFKSDDTGNIHMPVGKTSFSFEQLLENFSHAMDIIKRAKPQGVKGSFIKSVTLCSSMGKGIKVKV